MIISRRLVDPLEDGPACTRDILRFKELGINTIFVYSLRFDDKPGIHSVCMKALSEAGIYVIVGLFGPDDGIGRFQNRDYVMQSQQAAILDGLSEFPNLLGVIVDGSPITLPFVKEAVKDLKDHLVGRNVRRVPIGYLAESSTEDIDGNFLVCGNRDESLDFQMFMVNRIRYCETKSEERKAIYSEILSRRSASPVPMVLLQLDCPSEAQEDFAPFRQLYNSNLTNVHSGIAMFSYFDENYENRTIKGQFFFSRFLGHLYSRKSQVLLKSVVLAQTPGLYTQHIRRSYRPLNLR